MNVNQLVNSSLKIQNKWLGDYDQSIYAFNGSDIGIISTFSTRYDGATVFTLRKN